MARKSQKDPCTLWRWGYLIRDGMNKAVVTNGEIQDDERVYTGVKEL